MILNIDDFRKTEKEQVSDNLLNVLDNIRLDANIDYCESNLSDDEIILAILNYCYTVAEDRDREPILRAVKLAEIEKANNNDLADNIVQLADSKLEEMLNDIAKQKAKKKAK